MLPRLGTDLSLTSYNCTDLPRHFLSNAYIACRVCNSGGARDALWRGSCFKASRLAIKCNILSGSLQ